MYLNWFRDTFILDLFCRFGRRTWSCLRTGWCRFGIFVLFYLIWILRKTVVDIASRWLKLCFMVLVLLGYVHRCVLVRTGNGFDPQPSNRFAQFANRASVSRLRTGKFLSSLVFLSCLPHCGRTRSVRYLFFCYLWSVFFLEQRARFVFYSPFICSVFFFLLWLLLSTYIIKTEWTTHGYLSVFFLFFFFLVSCQSRQRCIWHTHFNSLYSIRCSLVLVLWLRKSC